MTSDSDIPTGWQRDPSRWGKRGVAAGLAFGGFAIAGYLAVYQCHVVSNVWDPFFGRGTQMVLTSKLSKMFPMPDAAIGAVVYFVEGITVLIGGTARWRTRPWIVLAYGGLSGLLGIAAIVLVLCQAFVVGAWCTLCLISAAISLTLAGLAIEEVWAAVWFLRHGQSGAGRMAHRIGGVK